MGANFFSSSVDPVDKGDNNENRKVAVLEIVYNYLNIFTVGSLDKLAIFMTVQMYFVENLGDEKILLMNINNNAANIN